MHEHHITSQPGGVRLEDDVVITSAGCENLTVCPRAVDEILDVMKGGAWPRELLNIYT